MASRAALTTTTATVVEVGIGRLADIEDLAGKAEVNACQVVVKVHLHVFVANLADDTHNRATVSGLHHQ